MAEPERRTDAWSRERITAVLKASVEDRRHLNLYLKWVVRAVAVQAVVLIVGLGLITGVPFTGYGGLLGASSDRADDSRRVATRLAELVGRIQSERTRNIATNCKDQNDRNLNTVKALDTRLAQLPPAQQERAQASRDFTVALINALAPVRDCKVLVAEQAASAQSDGLTGPTGPTGSRGPTP